MGHRSVQVRFQRRSSRKEVGESDARVVVDDLRHTLDSVRGRRAASVVVGSKNCEAPPSGVVRKNSRGERLFGSAAVDLVEPSRPSVAMQIDAPKALFIVLK